jgi:site-specific recombinase XerD
VINEIGLLENISYYWVRHSYATNAVRQGASMEYMQESLGHSDTKITQNYFAGFEEKAKKEIANKLMDFG